MPKIQVPSDSATSLAMPWAASTDYVAGQFVTYNGGLYAAKVDFTSALTFDPSDWDGGPAGPLAVSSYLPASDQSTAFSAAADGDIDAANVNVAFETPPSGAVIVQVQMAFLASTNSTSASSAGRLSLREGTTTVKEKAVENNSAPTSRTITFYVSGLTPGSAHTYKLGAHGNGSTGVTPLYGPIWGPVIMSVWAAP